jgi:hypothetical protein
MHTNALGQPERPRCARRLAPGARDPGRRREPDGSLQPVHAYRQESTSRVHDEADVCISCKRDLGFHPVHDLGQREVHLATSTHVCRALEGSPPVTLYAWRTSLAAASAAAARKP